MGDLAKYIAEVIEFVVAGILVLFSLMLLGYVIVQPDLADLPDELPFLTSLGALLPVFGLALIYALGILAEGVSRRVFEHGLAELTLAKLDGRGSSDAEADFAARRVAIAEMKEGDPARRRAAHDLHRSQVGYYENLREKWRMEVIARSAPLSAQVEGQLKRLRIERAAALSGSICSAALVLDVARLAGEPAWGLRVVTLVVTLVVTGCAIWLSLERLRRYLGSIVRCHDALSSVPSVTP